MASDMLAAVVLAAAAVIGSVTMVGLCIKRKRRNKGR
jgi:hypothetical protein